MRAGHGFVAQDAGDCVFASAHGPREQVVLTRPIAEFVQCKPPGCIAWECQCAALTEQRDKPDQKALCRVAGRSTHFVAPVRFGCSRICALRARESVGLERRGLSAFGAAARCTCPTGAGASTACRRMPSGACRVPANAHRPSTCRCAAAFGRSCRAAMAAHDGFDGAAASPGWIHVAKAKRFPHVPSTRCARSRANRKPPARARCMTSRQAAVAACARTAAPPAGLMRSGTGRARSMERWRRCRMVRMLKRRFRRNWDSAR